MSATLVVLAALVMPVSAQRASTDWTQWRGPNRDGAAPAVSDMNAWPEKLTQKWKVEVGQGYATPLVVGNRVYQFARKGEREVMMAIDANSGKVLWETGHTATFTMMPATKQHGPGPKSTPIFFNGRLYSIGMTGIVTAYDAASGKQLWQKPGSTVVPMFTTHSFSPVIDRGLVVFHLGGHDEGALTAFDANTGDQRWSW
jgi:outer membrane protein assembly factor BamB